MESPTFVGRIVNPEDQQRSSREVYFYSNNGEKIYPLDPYYCLSAITLKDIATSLSLAFKFNGMSRRPYSMAEHSIHLANLVHSQCADPEQTRLALLSTADVMAFGMRSVVQFNTPAEMALERLTWGEAIWGKFANPVMADYDLFQQSRNILLTAERLELLTIRDVEDRVQIGHLSSEAQVQVEWVRSELDRNAAWSKSLGPVDVMAEFISLYSGLTHDIGDGNIVEK